MFHKLMALLERLFKDQSKSYCERYLSQATDVYELERLQRNLQNRGCL